MSQVPAPQMVKVLAYDKLVRHECFIKHMSKNHELGWEWNVTTNSVQLFEEEGNATDVFRKMSLIASVTNDTANVLVEFVKEFCMKEVAAEKCTGARIEDADLKQLLQMLGNYALAEDHLADYIGREVSHMQDAKTDEEKAVNREQIAMLNNYLYTVRNLRKKLVSGLLDKPLV